MTQRPTTRRPVSGSSSSRRPIGGSLRRTRPVRRASAGLTPIRAGAALVMLATALATYGVANSAAFEYANLRIEGAALTDPTEIEAAIEGARGQNVFRIATEPLEAALGSLMTVADADVSVSLPDTLVARVEEREPILVWRAGARRYLVDAEGNIFARADERSDPSLSTLPVVHDRRATAAGLSIGRRIDGVDLDAATRLASLVPDDVGSEAGSLSVLVTDLNGFVVRAEPAGWDAVFGFYTPSLRTPELIPGQVRLLRSLVIGREPIVEKIILASDTDGTYIPKPSPAADDDDS